MFFPPSFLLLVHWISLCFFSQPITFIRQGLVSEKGGLVERMAQMGASLALERFRPLLSKILKIQGLEQHAAI